MLKLNKKLSKNGFSLIELMVAVVILAMVVFGIFLAFTTGFQGMAESKDRTVAVNYLQKTLEKYKDMPFKKIESQPMTQISGTIYSQGVIVIDTVEDSGEIKFKKVVAKVRWPDRDGNYKYEEASTLIYSTPKTGDVSVASKIVLYATPYYRIVPESDTLLVAEIQDDNNNLINDWYGRITYTITQGDSLGFLDKEFDLTNNGTSRNRFWSGTNTGIVIIEASADLENKGTVRDTVELTITTGAVAIYLEPQAGDDYLHVGDTATINLYILKADYDKNNPDIDYTGIIDLYVTPGFGSLLTLNDQIVIGVDDDGTATFSFTSNGQSGVVGITASATNLDMGYTEIVFGNEGYKIQLSADDSSILAGENTNIKITILDEELNPTPYTGTITLTGGPYGDGTEVIFDNSASENINFSYLTAGDITIDASGGILIDGEIVIEVTAAKTPSYIKIFCDKDELYTNESAQIYARIYDFNDDVVANYNEDVQFSITSGIGYLEDNSPNETLSAVNGITPSLDVSSYSHGTVTISADSTTSGGDLLTQGNINIDFYSLPDHMEITKSPETLIPANGSSSAEINVKVYGEEEDITKIYDYAINFSTNLTGSSFSNETVYPDNGVASTSISSTSEGPATITATNSSQSPYILEEVTIDVEFGSFDPTNLEFLSITLESWDKEKIVTFDINVTGSPLELKSMEVIWPKDNLNEIAIKSPHNASEYNPDIDIGVASPTSYVNDGTEINNTTFNLGQSSIRLIFDKSQKNNYVDVIFTDDFKKEYPVHFRVPSSS